MLSYFISTAVVCHSGLLLQVVTPGVAQHLGEDLAFQSDSCDTDLANSFDECALLQTGTKLQEATLGAQGRARQNSNMATATATASNQSIAGDGLIAVLNKASEQRASHDHEAGKKPKAKAKEKATGKHTGNLTAKADTGPKYTPLDSADFAWAVMAFSLLAALSYVALWYIQLHGMHSTALAPLLAAEFVGTFALVFTVGCCSVAGSSIWNATAIAAILMAMIYAVGPVSGGHLNPAVSFCLWLLGRETGHKMGAYCGVQVMAGICASLSITLAVAPIPTPVGPVAPYLWWHAGLVEAMYTAMLVFVVLNTACARYNNADENRFFAFAIGFVVIAGGYACGNISGANFNPAVSLGLELVTGDSVGWGFAWAAFQILGSMIAYVLFREVRPEEMQHPTAERRPIPLQAKCLAELLGTFVLVMTVGLNLVTNSGATAWSAAAALMCMIYSLGDVSGAHFNPAVTLAILCAGRQKCTIKDGCIYMFVQAVAGCLAGCFITGFHCAGPKHSVAIVLEAGKGHSILNASLGELIFTTLLAFTVLAVATTKKLPNQPVLHYFALCIGACVMVGGTSLGKVSGGELNPAVSFGIALSNVLFEVTKNGVALPKNIEGVIGSPVLLFCIFQMLGGLLASLLFRVVHMTQYKDNDTQTPVSLFAAEFLGTFYLVITVGFCSLGGSGTWNALAIALVLMVMIYDVASVSGAHLNPAVSLTLGFSKKNDLPTITMYWVAQISAGIAAGLCFCTFFDDDVPIKPQPGYTWVQGVAAEVIYTSMLCLVVTQCAAADGNNRPDRNQFYGLAIGFVIVAGGYAVGSISGACFNPAVTLGLSVSSALHAATGEMLKWGLVWSVFELLGSVVAFCLFGILRPWDFGARNATSDSHTEVVKCLAEFLGVFFLVVTVGLNVVTESPATALSAAAALMCMIYSFGDISGAHLNPAVTLSIVLSGRGKCAPSVGIAYAASQMVAAILAGHLYAGFHMSGPNRDVSFPLEPHKGYAMSGAGLLEMFFTGMLAYTVLAVATTTKSQPYNFGLTIAACVIAGGFAAGGISGGELNPAVSLGISLANLGHKGSHHSPAINFVAFGLWELSGGVIAAVVFRITHSQEYFVDSLAYKAAALQRRDENDDFAFHGKKQPMP